MPIALCRPAAADPRESKSLSQSSVVVDDFDERRTFHDSRHAKSDTPQSCAGNETWYRDGGESEGYS